jgi:hypothetical protein
VARHPDGSAGLLAGVSTSAIGLIGAWLVIPARRPSAQGRVDWVGGIILGVALVLLLMPLSQGNT